MNRVTHRLRPAGDSAVLVELDHLTEVVELNRALGRSWPIGIWDVVPAARTILVRFEPESISAQAVADWLSAATLERAGPVPTKEPVRIPVRYDGADLVEVARLTGLGMAQVVTLHCAAEYTVAFCGFAPGFAYLTGLPQVLRVPRRSSPRARVPAGAVALAAEFSAIYPTESPGGWQLIGQTAAPIFDLSRDPPALLTPGTVVRFVELPR